MPYRIHFSFVRLIIPENSIYIPVSSSFTKIRHANKWQWRKYGFWYGREVCIIIPNCKLETWNSLVVLSIKRKSLLEFQHACRSKKTLPQMNHFLFYPAQKPFPTYVNNMQEIQQKLLVFLYNNSEKSSCSSFYVTANPNIRTSRLSYFQNLSSVKDKISWVGGERQNFDCYTKLNRFII